MSSSRSILQRVLALLCFGFISSFTWAQSQSPYQLQAEALWDFIDGNNTEITLTVTATDPSSPLPTSLRVVQIRGLEFEYGDAAHRTFKNVPLTVSGGVAQVTLSAPEFPLSQMLEITVVLPAGSSPRSYVLHASTVVGLRIDVVIRDLLVPDPLIAGEPTELVVVVGEDTGIGPATADVSLYYSEADDGTGLVLFGQVTGVAIPAGGAVPVPITGTFPASGSFTVYVVISSVTPREFDELNNEGNQAVVVLPAGS